MPRPRTLDAIVLALDRDRSYVVSEALATFTATRRWQVEHIRQGLREAQAGDFVPAAGVNKVLRRLRGK